MGSAESRHEEHRIERARITDHIRLGRSPEHQGPEPEPEEPVDEPPECPTCFGFGGGEDSHRCPTCDEPPAW